MRYQLHEHFFSPYSIFIKEGPKLSDNKIMVALGLEDYKIVSDEKERNNIALNKRYIYLTEDEHWTYVMDDLSYTLWYSKEIRKRILLLSNIFEIFSCSIGDIDDSFDFTYFKHGEIIREYVVEDPKFNGGEVVKNVGLPFPIEDIALKKTDTLEKVCTIAASFGIKMNQELAQVRVYARHEYVSERLDLNNSKW